MKQGMMLLTALCTLGLAALEAEAAPKSRLGNGGFHKPAGGPITGGKVVLPRSNPLPSPKVSGPILPKVPHQHLPGHSSPQILKGPAITTKHLPHKVQGPAAVRHLDKLLTGRGKIQTLAPTVVHKDYHVKCGVKCDFGYCYKGHTHGHWQHKCWLPSCGCHCYWCPCTLVYFYWCEPDQCWYPITYCPYGCYTF